MNDLIINHNGRRRVIIFFLLGKHINIYITKAYKDMIWFCFVVLLYYFRSIR